ncbi:hypothetical protein CK503_00875 [Aliifodinibius salipaludis]|uniref:Collagen-like protein n=1 Tax=Fodinibius salipaludis TaxID=2032627 RepID=A0A2A2GFI5_9BACT|nr:collagen-like protein [Aliifodinibius salipaludis]PAU95649.1 hypothetical protein CK503_00875 [Aliifodinibius salipaludis]
MYKISRIVLSILLVSLIALACEGPSGSEGPQGPQGEAGPIGPAGEDGSVMYAGPDAPTADIGNEGDYYLNSNTGEYYGLKDSNGWGNPIIILMGEDGQDGEDGSQIYSGTGAPDASLGVEGDYYLDKDSYELYGPKTSTGWGSPLNLKGADGNANVTRYIFPGHNFEQDYRYILNTNGIVESASEMRENIWLVYVIDNIGTYHHLPGEISGGAGTYNRYAISHEWNGSGIRIIVELTDGNGDEYSGLEVVRIETSSTEDRSKRSGNNATIYNDLNTSNYNEVAEYYGFYK